MKRLGRRSSVALIAAGVLTAVLAIAGPASATTWSFSLPCSTGLTYKSTIVTGAAGSSTATPNNGATCGGGFAARVYYSYGGVGYDGGWHWGTNGSSVAPGGSAYTVLSGHTVTNASNPICRGTSPACP